MSTLAPRTARSQLELAAAAARAERAPSVRLVLVGTPAEAAGAAAVLVQALPPVPDAPRLAAANQTQRKGAVSEVKRLLIRLPLTTPSPHHLTLPSPAAILPHHYRYNPSR